MEASLGSGVPKKSLCPVSRRASASIAAVVQSHLSELEAGKRNASVDLLGAIAFALAVPVAALFKEAPDLAGPRALSPGAEGT